MEMSVRFVLDERDKTMLEEIARRDGNASMSAVLRRLIRNEAATRNIQVEEEKSLVDMSNGGLLAK
jgi:hypothetical protein